MLRGYLMMLAVLAPAEVFAAEAARVALDLKPGLWETTRTTRQQGAPDYDLSHLGPEQRAKLEALQKQFESAPPETDTRRTCVTADELTSDPFQDRAHPGTQCVRTTLESSSKTLHVKIVCTGLRPRTGEMKLKALSPEKLKGSYDVASPGPESGDGFRMTATWTSKWLGAECGDVK